MSENDKIEFDNNQISIEELENEKVAQEEVKEEGQVEAPEDGVTGGNAELQKAFEEFFAKESESIALTLRSIMPKVNIGEDLDWEGQIAMYNIVMYEFIKGILLEPQHPDYLAHKIVEASVPLFKVFKAMNHDEFFKAFAERYLEMKFSINPTIPGEENAKQIAMLVATSSELRGEEHINTADSFALLILMYEFKTGLKEDIYDILNMIKKAF